MNWKEGKREGKREGRTEGGSPWFSVQAQRIPDNSCWTATTLLLMQERRVGRSRRERKGG